MGDTLGMVADVINETAPLPHPLTKQGGRRGTGGTLVPGLFPQLDSSLLQVCVHWPITCSNVPDPFTPQKSVVVIGQT